MPEDVEIPVELQDWGVQQAFEEQTKIGWHNFMKGRITSKFGTIQMKAYEKEDSEIPAHFSATWWTAGLVKEVIYVGLNTWQQRNRFLHDKESMARDVSDRTEALEEMANWYDKKHMFPSTDQVHFHRSFVERCSDTTKQVRLWLQKISDLYEYNKQRTLVTFFFPP